MRLATENPGRLFHGQPGWRLPNQPQKLLLFFFHVTAFAETLAGRGQLQPSITISNPVQI